MYRVDQPSDVKRGGVCIYYKTMLPLKVLSKNFLQECFNFIHLYRTPSQSQDEFHDFLTILEMNLDGSFNSTPFLTTIIGDFNAKSNNPVDTRRRFNVYTTSIRRQRCRIDVETTSCVCWEMVRG